MSSSDSEGLLDQATAAMQDPTVLATTVDVELSDVSATASLDYTDTPVTIQFDVGETTKSVPIPILSDDLVEPDELVNLSFAADFGVAGNQQPTSQLLIDDDDSATLTFDDVQVTEGDSGEKLTVLFATLDKPVETGITVEYETFSSTAIVGSDFVWKRATFDIPHGRTGQSFPIEIIGDEKVEENETLTIRAN